MNRSPPTKAGRPACPLTFQAFCKIHKASLTQGPQDRETFGRAVLIGPQELKILKNNNHKPKEAKLNK